MKNYCFILAMLLFTSSVSVAQRDDKKKGDGTGAASVEGVVYSLPRTGIRIHVKAVQKKFFHGPYFQYAEALLGIKNAPSTDSERWTIKDIQIETFSETDPAHVYKTTGDIASLVSLTESGILAAINQDIETPGETYSVATFLSESEIPDIPFPDLSLNPFYEVADKADKSAIVAKSFQEKAQEAAHTVTKLRKRRFKALANAYEEQLPDGRAYEVMVEELHKLEEEYVGLFVGKSYKQTFAYSFDFVPGDHSVSGEVVFRFSESKGVLPKTDLSGKPVVVDMKELKELSSAQNKLKASNNPVAGQSGVYYRMPGKAEIRIMNGLHLMATTRATVAQFGTVAPLPESLVNGNYRITFHPKTGAIKSVLKSGIPEPAE